MYQFLETTRAIVETVRRIVENHQVALERRMLAGEQLTPKDYEPGTVAAREAGLWGLTAPAELGGAEISTVDYLAIVEENSKVLAPIHFGGSCPLPTLYILKGQQKARYLDPILEGSKHLCLAQTEPGGGADPVRAIKTRAEKRGDQWVINGSKIWISSFSRADYVFVIASTDKSQGAVGISMFAVEADNPGMIAREVPMLGNFKTHQLTFDNCRVDEFAMIGEEGAGFKAAQKALSKARFEVCARALGIAQRCYEMMVDYSKERVVFGSVLAEKQAIQSMIVDSWIEIQQARLMMYACAEKEDRGEDTRIEAGMMKMLGTEMVGRVIDRAIQIHGGAGCTYESVLAHWYDSQRMARIYEGPTEVHKYRVLARHLLA